MSIKKNFHTHTTYCDGKNTPEETVKAAIALGFTALGFSGHAHTPFDLSYAMSHAAADKYYAEINALKAEYCGRIELYCGIEQDYYSDEPVSRWDYVIGSVHYVLKNGEYIPVDETAQILKDAAIKHYGGDIYGLVEDYFATVADVVGKTNADIIGHFDLITKFNEGEAMFSESDPRYVDAYRAALIKLIPYNKPFEINTGAMARGYRSVSYPSKQILQDIYNMGGSIAISSDCHDKAALDYGFDEAASLAKSCGFKRFMVITKDGLKSEEL